MSSAAGVLAAAAPFAQEAARLVWSVKYRCPGQAGGADADIEATWRRVARALAAPETAPAICAAQFYDAIAGFKFLPGGRILAHAGLTDPACLFNCFVSGPLDDQPGRLERALDEAADTLALGGGLGIDFSGLRGTGTRAAGGPSGPGPVNVLQRFQEMCDRVTAQRTRRGAMMGVLADHHPDIEAFIDAKREPGLLPSLNLSVLVSDALLAAVREDGPWALRDPSGPADARPRVIPARALWQRIARNAAANGEPGVLFIDRIRAADNLGYCETIAATNPCGEIPLPCYGACNLGSINLTRFVRSPYADCARLDLAAIAALVPTAVRMLDNAYDVSAFPVDEQRRTALAARRIGLGLTGLADALTMLGLPYDSVTGRRIAGQAMRTITHAAYRASLALARERGPFPLFTERYVEQPFVARLPENMRHAMRAHGLRNSHLTAIAPAGSISLLAGNVSSGLEPATSAVADRIIRDSPASTRRVTVENYACLLYRGTHPDEGLPPAFRNAGEIDPWAQMAMQAALQAEVDNAISKTIALPAGTTAGAVAQLFLSAADLGLKGCTVFPPDAARGAVVCPSCRDVLPAAAHSGA